MSTGCPTREALIAHLDGEATVNQASAIAEHLAGCAGCRKVEAQLRALTGAIAAASSDRSEGNEGREGREGAGAPIERRLGPAVLARLDAAEGERRALQLRLRYASAAGFLLLLASLGAMVVRDRRVPDQPGMFAARGPSTSELDRAKHFGFSAWIDQRSLEAGDRVSLGEGLRFTVYNRSGADSSVMLLAIDQAGEIHWFHPAYLDANSDPAPLKLDAHPETLELSERVAPEGAALGPLMLVGLFGEPTLKVKAVEAALGHPARIEALSAPGRVIHTLPLILEAGR